MAIPDEIIDIGITLKDRYFDLRRLSVYSSLGVGTIRDYIREGTLPYFKIKGKILIRKSEFDEWMEEHRGESHQDINGMVNEIMNNLKTGKSGDRQKTTTG